MFYSEFTLITEKACPETTGTGFFVFSLTTYYYLMRIKG